MKKAAVLLFTVSVRLIADGPLFYMFVFLYFQKEGYGGVNQAVFNGALLAVFGISHSLLARDFSKRVVAQLVGEDSVRLVYVIISGISFSAVLILWEPLAGELWRLHGFLFWSVSAIYFGSIIGMVIVTFYIDYHDFLGISIIIRKRLNKPEKKPVFSVKGPYAHCRHPLYFLLLIVFWAAPVMTWGRFEFALIGSIYLYAGTYLEELNLRKELGPIYDYYIKNVPMWFPRLTPWRIDDFSEFD